MNREIGFFFVSFVMAALVLYVTARFWFSDFRNRHMTSFFLMGFVVACWTLLSGVSPVVDRSYFSVFYTLALSLTCVMPYSLLWFFLAFSESSLARSKIVQSLIVILPLLDILALGSNPLHGMYLADYGFPRPEKAPLFWVHTALAYTVILAGVIRFLPYVFKTFRRNPPVLLSAVCVISPWVINIIFVLDVFPLTLNFTPLAFCASFFVFFFFSYYSHLFNFRSALLSRIFEFYQDGIVLVDRNGIILDYNTGIMGNFSGFTLVPQETRFVDFVRYLEERAVSCEPPEFFEGLKRAFSGGEFTIHLKETERSFVVKRQLLTWDDAPGFFLKKNAIGYAISFTDATGEKEQNRRLLELKIAAEAASNAKSNFLANTSHEIRTPLNAILGMAELILRRNAHSSDYDDALNIKQAGTSLLAVINDVLDFSKIESGKLEIVPQEYRFTELLAECISIIQLKIGEKHIRFLTNIDSALPEKLYGDPVRIRQILLNVLSNAVKYTTVGFIRMAVRGVFEEGEPIAGPPRGFWWWMILPLI
jgi:signal transduction histidine kinase